MQRTQTPETMTDTEKLQRIRQQRAEAARRYRQRHPERIAAITARYWAKKAAQMQQAQQEGGAEQ